MQGTYIHPPIWAGLDRVNLCYHKQNTLVRNSCVHCLSVRPPTRAGPDRTLVLMSVCLCVVSVRLSLSDTRVCRFVCYRDVWRMLRPT